LVVSEDIAEQSLLTLARAAAPDALAVLYRRHGAELYAVALRLTHSQQDAEDVVQDVFLGLPEALRRYDGLGPIQVWLRQVTTRVALMRLRRRRRRERRESRATHAGRPRRDLTEDVVNRVDLENALAEVPEPLRTVFVLKEMQGYSHQEIGAMLGVTPQLSAIRLYRARKRLARILWSDA
jgi:RNA polymerase sigma-70 factor (ECF subfamily)